MEVETGKRDAEGRRNGLDVEREWSVWRNSELDGFWFFGLNIPQVVEAMESQEASLYHAFPPAGYPSYRYHQVQPRVEQVIRVREERVGVCEGREEQFEESQIQRVPTRHGEANGLNGSNGSNGPNGSTPSNPSVPAVPSNPSAPSAPTSPDKAMCSRCVPVQTTVTPLAWTLSTLRQTLSALSDARSRPVWEAGDTLGTTELLRQYRALQVGGEKGW